MYLINTGKFMTYYIFNLKLYSYENLYGGKSHLQWTLKNT